MRPSRFTDEQIIGIVKEYEAGAKLAELCRRHGVSTATFYKWRAKYGGMGGSGAKRPRGLEGGKPRPEELLAGAMLHKQALKRVLGKKLGRPRRGGRRGGMPPR